MFKTTLIEKLDRRIQGKGRVHIAENFWVFIRWFTNPISLLILNAPLRAVNAYLPTGPWKKLREKCKSGGSFIINWQLLSCVTVANLGSKRLKQRDFLVIIWGDSSQSQQLSKIKTKDSASKLVITNESVRRTKLSSHGIISGAFFPRHQALYRKRKDF